MKTMQKKKGSPANSAATPSQAQLNTLSQKMDAVLKKIPKGTFRATGGMLGGMVAGPGGRMAGRAIGSGLSTITGYGDYAIGPGIASSHSDPGVPQFTRHGNGIHVSHREYVGQVTLPASSNFDATHYILNPGNATLFPWLANLARNFQEYKFKGLVFSFQTRTSEYAADNAMGTVMMATNYNVQERPFSNATNLLNTQFAVSSKPSVSFMHAIECDPKLASNPYRYVRDSLAQDDSVISDPRFYDLGRTTLATEGIPGAPGYVVGALYVSYDIELITPVMNPSAAEATTLYPSTISVSTLDAGPYDNTTTAPNAVVQRCRFVCPSVTPLATTTYNRIPSLPALSPSAFFPASLANAVSFEANIAQGYRIRFKKAGLWRVTIKNSVSASSNNAYLASNGAQLDPEVTESGGLTLSSYASLVATTPHFTFANSPTTYWDTSFTFDIVGTDGGAGDYVDIDSGYFESMNISLVTGWDIQLQFEWAKSLTANAEAVTS